MKMAIRVFMLLVFIISTSRPISSLYEDQVGLADWHQQYIGKVKHAVFHTQKAGRKRVIVSTEENVVASLDLRHGEIFWRHVLGPKDVIDQLDIALGKYVVTLSSGGSVVRAWGLPDGQMVWESRLQGSRSSRSLLVIPKNLKVDKDSLMFVYGNGYIHAVANADGEVIWKKDLASEGFEAHQLMYADESDALYAVGLIDSSWVGVYQLNVKNGAVLGHEKILFPGGFSGDFLFVSNDKAVAVDASGTNLVVIRLRNGQVYYHPTPITEFILDFSGVGIILPSKIPEMFILRTETSVTFFKVVNEDELRVVEKLDLASTISDSIPVSEGDDACAMIQQDDDKIILTVKSNNDWTSNLAVEKIQMDHQRGQVQKVFLNSYVRTDRSNGFRVLIVMEDHSLLLLQQGKIVWSREDGLASIIDVKASELPIEKDGVAVDKVEHGLLERLKGHLLKVKGSLMIATPDDLATIQKMRVSSSDKTKMTRDRNGFRKLLIVLTRAGKLFALHTGDGRIVWSLLLNSHWRSKTCGIPSFFSLHQWQDPHHHALDENPSMLVIGRCGDSLDSAGVLSIVDAYRGKELDHIGPIHSIAQVIPLPFTDSLERRLHLLLDANQQAHLYPRTVEALGIFQQELGNIYWYSVDRDESILRGHGLKKTYLIEVTDNFCFDARNVWTIVLPSDTEKIIATATRSPNEVVHTQAKVTAEHDVLYKHISKNLLFLATVTPKAEGPIGSVTPDASSMVVYVIETVSGRILHRATHAGSQGPVHAIFSENWVVYHFFNLKAHRYEMAVIEIYDQARAENKDMLKLVLGAHNLTSPVTAYSRLEVSMKSQSYFFTHSVKAMVVTQTIKGITSRQVLVGTVGDQVLALDKRFLDPRRTVNPTQAEKEEGIIPLTDSLPIIPQSYVTHALKVEGLRDIVTFPAKLESTTLVFAYGIDLFFARLAPSKTYDSLTEEFNYALLLITIVALVVGIFVTWIWSEKKELQDKWR